MTGKVLKLKDVRLAFTKNLFVPGSYQDQADKPKKFKAKFLIPKDHPQIQEVKDEIMRLATEEWKDKAQSVLVSIRDNPMKFAFSDGDKKDYEGFAGNFCISAANATKPLYLRANPGTKERPNLITAESGELYSGCRVVAHVSFWTFNKSGAQMNCNLLGVQFYAPGEAFSGGGTTSTDEFGNEESVVVGASSAADMFS